MDKGPFVRRDNLRTKGWEGLEVMDYTEGGSFNSSLAAVTVPPGGRHSEAWSSRSEKFYLVVHGSVNFLVERESQLLGVGDLCIVRKGQTFSYINDTSEPARLILIHTPMFDLADEHFVLENP